MKPSRKAREEAGGKNYDGFSLPPHACYVIGVDTQHGPDHPLYGQRAVDVAAGRKPYDGRMLRSMRVHGVIEPVRVRLEQVPDTMPSEWPPGMHGKLVHVVVTGRHRILHARKVVDDMFAAGALRDTSGWQVKCVLEHSKDPRDLIGVQIAENVCRRVPDDDEKAQSIVQGLNVGLTLEELADRLGLTMAKAKRLQRRAEGVPEKPKEKRPRVPAAAINNAIAKLRERGADCEIDNGDIADLVDCIRGKMDVKDAHRKVRRLLGAEDA